MLSIRDLDSKLPLSQVIGMLYIFQLRNFTSTQPNKFLGDCVVLFQMAEVSRPADDDFRKVMALTGVDEATAKKVLEESGGDLTTTINKLLDDLEDDMGAPVVNQVLLSVLLSGLLLAQSQFSVSGQQLP